MKNMELINVRNENGKLLVSARDLHEALESKERFSKWFDRMLSYGFEENVDFTSVQKSTVVHNGAKKEIGDYALKIDMAKEIAMLQHLRSHSLNILQNMSQTVFTFQIQIMLTA